MAPKKVKKGSLKKKSEDKPVKAPEKAEAPSPAAEPAGKKKEPAGDKEKVIDPEKEAAKLKLSQEAIVEIKAGLEVYNKGRGGEYVLRGWSKKYRAVLGPFKQFLIAQPKHFIVKEDARGVFTVGLVGKPPPSPVMKAGKPGAETWPQLCEKAWDAYCFQVQKEKRSEMAFISGFPRAAREALSSSSQDAAKVDIVRASKKAAAAKAAVAVKVEPKEAVAVKEEPKEAAPSTKKKVKKVKAKK
mmetsp:Transcript_58970/g.140796  ORF Transcript_58970/g.140796 Transcript_58970/m.140796 type:complete len:243 (+) Transcript_58970:43-771(+)